MMPMRLPARSPGCSVIPKGAGHSDAPIVPSGYKILSGRNVFRLIRGSFPPARDLRGHAPANGWLCPPPYLPRRGSLAGAGCRALTAFARMGMPDSSSGAGRKFSAGGLPQATGQRAGIRAIPQWRFRLRVRDADLRRHGREGGGRRVLSRLRRGGRDRATRRLGHYAVILRQGRRDRNHLRRLRRLSRVLRRGATHRLVIVPGDRLRPRPGDIGHSERLRIRLQRRGVRQRHRV